MKAPSTPGQLYDVLQNWFGFGVWDETSPIPYYISRMRQVTKLDKLLQERATSVEQMYTAAIYCRDRKIPIRTPLGLCAHMRDALAEEVTVRELARMKAVQSEIEAAVDWEKANHPEDMWLGQLLRVQGDANQREVLARWKRARARTR